MWTICPRGLPWVLAPLVQPWGLIAAGAATVVQAHVSSLESGLALFFFCLIATSSYLAMELYAGFRPEQEQRPFVARQDVD